MTCSCGDTMNVEGASREEAVSKLQTITYFNHAAWPSPVAASDFSNIRSR